MIGGEKRMRHTLKPHLVRRLRGAARFLATTIIAAAFAGATTADEPPEPPPEARAILERYEELKAAGQSLDGELLVEEALPRFPDVPQLRKIHAWHLTYNVSVTTDDPNERWYWVVMGIDEVRLHVLRRCGMRPSVGMMVRRLTGA